MANGQSRQDEVRAYEYAGRKRLTLPTRESAVELDEATIADKRASIEVEQSSYPRLAWKRGKDDADISVTHGPLYVHEKVNSVEFLKSLLKDSTSEQPDMFSSFNGAPAGAVFEPYQHSGNWTNRLIRAPSQRMMASLLEREGMRGKVDLVYMDPPYNIDFRSNWQGLIDDLDVREELASVPYDLGQITAFRDAYKDGVHSYLDQLRLQLILARALLSNTGNMFVQIGPSNLHVVGLLMSEVFGHENHVATIPFISNMNHSTRMLPEIGNWLIWFAKDKPESKYHQLYEKFADRGERLQHMAWGTYVEIPGEPVRSLATSERRDPSSLPENAVIYERSPLTSDGHATTGRSDPWVYGANAYPCPAGKHWRVSHEGLQAIAAQGRMDLSGNVPYWKKYESEIPGVSISSWNWIYKADQDKTYVVQTPSSVVERCILMTTDPGDLILDPTCGSGTTAIAAEKWGRRWITSDTSEVAVAGARRKIMAQFYDWYMLQDSPEGARLEHELSGGNPEDFVAQESYGEAPSCGFVYERQRRLSARMLAYDIHEYIEFVNRPHVKSRVKRLTSSFTVESDSPFTTEGAESHERDSSAQATRERVLIRITVAGLPLPNGSHYRVEEFGEYVGEYLTHKGLLVNEEGDVKRAMFHIADEDTLLSVAHILQAKREARLSGESPDALVMIAFGIGRKVTDSMLSQGGLDVYIMQANRDLMIPQLDNGKNAGARTSFALVSDPDLTVFETIDKRLTVRVNGLDVYNAQTGLVEAANSRLVSCMMVDTDFDTESFFARRVNYPNRSKGYDGIIERLRSAFNQQIDDEKWVMMKSDTTVPFDRPESGLICVKLIDRTGTEHEKVLDLNSVIIEAED